MAEIDNKPKHKHTPKAKKMLVRYGRMGLLGWFSHNEAHLEKSHTRIMIKTERGLEIGEVVGEHCYKAGQFKKTCPQVAAYFGEEGKGYPLAAGGEFVRYATERDLSEERHINRDAREELKCCSRFVKEMNLPMKLVDIEHVFGGERIIFYFSAESRVDFRELVKRIAKEYQTRIEMRQVGARDAARITSDIETCGQPCCCSRFLKVLKPVNMRMAKLQKATLDPAKISGYCGRLKCCLRYEDKTYKELSKLVPKRRARVKSAQGEGIVIDSQVLTQLVQIKGDNGEVYSVNIDEVEILAPPQKGPKNNGPDKAQNNKRAAGRDRKDTAKNKDNNQQDQ